MPRQSTCNEPEIGEILRIRLRGLAGSAVCQHVFLSLNTGRTISTRLWELPDPQAPQAQCESTVRVVPYYAISTWLQIIIRICMGIPVIDSRS